MKKMTTHPTSRPSRDRVLMDTAWVFAHRGTCSRLAVGAVASMEGRILTTGYNGVPAGLPHCNHDCDCGSIDKYANLLEPHYSTCSMVAPCTNAVHAEANAVAFAARHGVGLKGAELHVTHMPCKNCAMLIINAGIVRVAYDQLYRIQDGIELLLQADVIVEGHDRV